METVAFKITTGTSLVYVFVYCEMYFILTII